MAASVLNVSPERAREIPRLERIVRAQARETAGAMKNLSNTTVASEGYRKLVDSAVTAVQSGVEDYGSAIRHAIREAGGSGLRVKYESGETRRLDTAIRMNILDGVRHLTQQVLTEVGREFGADGVEIDAHMLCAEDHLPYQGRQFSNDEFEEIQSSLARPFGEWNCRHVWHPILLGVSAPAYTEAEREEMRQYSTEEVEIDGRTKTRYEWSQEMRRCETAVRATKDTANLAREAGDDELRRQCQRRINALNDHYTHLASAAGLKPEYTRTYVGGFVDAGNGAPHKAGGPVAARNYVGASDRLFEMLRYVKPVPGFSDYGCHGNPYDIEIETNNGQTTRYNAIQFAEIINADTEYHGGNVRLLSCTTGQEEDGFARQLAEALHVSVLAPTEVLWVSDGQNGKRPMGEIFVTNIESLAYLWYDGIDVRATGEWRKYNPDGTWETTDEKGVRKDDQNRFA